MLPVVRGERAGVREEDNVGRPLADQMCVPDGVGCSAHYTELLVADLISVAVSRTQEISGPALVDEGWPALGPPAPEYPLTLLLNS